NHPDRQRLPRADRSGGLALVARTPAAEIQPGEFGRATTDIEQDGAWHIDFDQIRAAGHRKFGFGFAVDYLELQAHFALDAVEERSRIGCRAARVGRNDACLDALMLGELAAAELERLDRALHRRFGKPAGLAQPLPQSNDARKAIKHAKAILSRLGDQETAI